MSVAGSDGEGLRPAALVLARPDELELARKDDELFVRVGPYRRTIMLPGVLSTREVVSADLDGDRLIFKADSNTDITKGLISLLVRIFSGQKVDDIIDADLFFIDKIGMGSIVGSQRSNGLVAMIKQMKLYALAYKTKLSK